MRRRSSALLAAFATTVGSAVLLIQAPSSFAADSSASFGDSQTGSWTVPQGVSSVTIHAVGGSGGDSNDNGPGGRGADVTAQLPVASGQTLSVHVAGNGSIHGAGANGGGAEGWYGAMGGGGGASDVRIGGDDLVSRVLVAGGGGGGSQDGDPPFGGDAGAAGGNGLANYCGGQAAQPGTQSGGGAGSVGCAGYSNGSPGSLGQGGDGASYDGSSAGGGGGGGYYGGGSGGDYQGGAGGSSYVTPDATSSTSGLAMFGTSPSVVITWTAPDPTTATRTSLAVTSHRLIATVAPLPTATATPTGTVRFRLDGRIVGTATLTGGSATLAYHVRSGRAHTVSARYSGGPGFSASSASMRRRDPVITAKVISSSSRTAYGWYHSAVRVVFHCTPHGAPLTAACPASVTLTHNGAGQLVRRTVSSTDGGTGTAAVSLNIDRTRPTITLRGVVNGARYFGTAPPATCTASDALSGPRACRVMVRRSASGSHSYIATASDRAGNRASVTGRYAVDTLEIRRAAYRNGAYTVRLGRTITLQYTGRGRPQYVNAAPTPRRPYGAGPWFHRAGTIASGPLWTLQVTITKNLYTHRSWNLGVRIGHAIRVVRVRVAGA